MFIPLKDKGVGILPDEIEEIFEGGKDTGLGLFLAREILIITDITIKETGEPGNGVWFKIFLAREPIMYV